MGADPRTKKHPFLKARFQIGSCKGPINYAASEPTFHPDDIPASKKASKAASLKWARGGTFPGEKSLWNASSAGHLYSKKFGLRTRINADHDRARYAYNFRAEELPPKNFEPLPKTHKFKIDVMPESRKQTIRQAAIDDPSYNFKTCNLEMPVSTKLRDKPRWNIEQFCSGLAEHEKIREDRQNLLLTRARANTAKVSQRLDNYTKIHKLPLRRLPPTYKRRFDDWTPEMAAAREAALEPLPSTKNRCATSKKPSRRRSFGHSGVFEYNGQEGAWMWSDTGSFVQNDPYGDRNKVFDTNRGNYAAPTSSL